MCGTPVRRALTAAIAVALLSQPIHAGTRTDPRTPTISHGYGGVMELEAAGDRRPTLLFTVPEDIRTAAMTGERRVGAPRQITERGIDQNSEFMIGTILVNLIFPESEGGSENWTAIELDNAFEAVFWAIAQYSYYTTLADFIIRMPEFYKSVPVSVEPIEGDWTSDPVWIGEVLVDLGFDGSNHLLGTHDLNNYTRELYDADWVFTAYIVDASANGCWQGPSGGYVGYTYLGGPYLVLPYPACHLGGENGCIAMFAHLMNHIFWALDEYETAQLGCDELSGYLAIGNLNTRYMPCRDPLDECIMDIFPASVAYPSPICIYTFGQMGAWDANGNDRPDVYEIPPWIELAVQGDPDTIYSDAYTITGSAWNEAVPNENPFQDPAARNDYAPWLVEGTYRINDGPDISFPPSDGTWDEPEEDVSHEVSGFRAGFNTVTVQVGNCVAYAEDFQIEVYYDVTATQLRDFSVSQDESGIEVEWEVEQVSDGARFFVLRANAAGGEYSELDRVEVLRDALSFSFRDTGCEPGATYRYRIDVSDEEGRRVLFRTGPVRIPVARAALYQNRPNPFNPSTEVTFSIPSDMRVTLEVFDVRGRIVATLVDGVRERGVHSVVWDGRNRHGRDVGSGIYYCRLRAGKEAFTRKMVLLR